MPSVRISADGYIQYTARYSSHSTGMILHQWLVDVSQFPSLTLRLLMSYIYGAPSKARNANVVYIWTYVWQR